jgi:hypothetical protein
VAQLVADTERGSWKALSKANNESIELYGKVVAHDPDTVNFGTDASERIFGWDALRKAATNSVHPTHPVTRVTLSTMRTRPSLFLIDGTYPLTIVGASGTLTRSAAFTLVILPGMPWVAGTNAGFTFVVIGIGVGVASAVGGLAMAMSARQRSEVVTYGGYYYCRKHRVPLWYVEGRLWCPIEQRHLRLGRRDRWIGDGWMTALGITCQAAAAAAEEGGAADAAGGGSRAAAERRKRKKRAGRRLAAAVGVGSGCWNGMWQQL